MKTKKKRKSPREKHRAIVARMLERAIGLLPDERALHKERLPKMTMRELCDLEGVLAAAEAMSYEGELPVGDDLIGEVPDFEEDPASAHAWGAW